MLDFRHRQLGWASAAIMTLGLLSLPEAGFARDPKLVLSWMSRAPQIDGPILDAEWSEATFIDLGDGVSIRIGNDARTLYLALLDSRDQGRDANDWVTMLFDDEGGIAPILYDDAFENPTCQATPELGEGVFVFYQLDVHFMEFVHQLVCATQISTDRVSFSPGVGNEGLTYEIAIPLDGRAALQADPGERFNFSVQLIRDGANVGCLPGCVQGWPTGFLDLMLASEV